MSAAVPNAAPREKSVKFGTTRYRVIERSYINGAIREPSEEIYLPEGVQPGTNLTKVDGASVNDDGSQVSAAEAFVGRNGDLVIADVPSLTDEQLDEYANAERGGRARVGVLAAFDKEVGARKQP